MATGTHLLSYNNVAFEGYASDSTSSDNTQPDNGQNNAQTSVKDPMSMRCAEYLGATLLQDFLEMDKASQEIMGHIAYLMAHSLHIHGERWAHTTDAARRDGNSMIRLLQGWSKMIKNPSICSIFRQ